jgi:predicted  nucleic acid-binding Zn-ribbon protein
LSTNKQINDERRWVIAVSKIIKSYNTKMQRVEAHIIALRKEMKMLYRKKKQIENLKLQRALEAKLKEAKAELKTLTDSLKHVARKQGELNKSGRSLRETIAGIQGQLAKLRGQHMFKKCKPGFKYNKKSKKCRSICKKGKKFSRKSKKCVSRCKKGKKWNKKSKKCVAKKGKGKGKKAKKAPKRK